ncbi:hypothetical protein A5906_37025 [Bradyrhizobium sacchari]|nr:hypothetical protein A5906_37025 [Bradyrhizobium sacchari]
MIRRQRLRGRSSVASGGESDRSEQVTQELIAGPLAISGIAMAQMKLERSRGLKPTSRERSSPR